MIRPDLKSQIRLVHTRFPSHGFGDNKHEVFCKEDNWPSLVFCLTNHPTALGENSNQTPTGSNPNSYTLTPHILPPTGRTLTEPPTFHWQNQVFCTANIKVFTFQTFTHQLIRLCNCLFCRFPCAQSSVRPLTWLFPVLNASPLPGCSRAGSIPQPLFIM